MKNVKWRNNPPWINGDIVHALRKKESARPKFLSSPADFLRAKFKEETAVICGVEQMFHCFYVNPELRDFLPFFGLKITLPMVTPSIFV